MLFNSYIFIFCFLPITMAGFYAIGRGNRSRAALVWLVGASFTFYGYWDPPYLILMFASIVVNFALGFWIRVLKAHERSNVGWLLGVGIAANLVLIGYFKYAGFAVDNWNTMTGSSVTIGDIVLPLGISFYTFQQIAYLVDVSRGETHGRSFLQYCLFVVFFPQLIAGPIVHPGQVLPQFANERVFRLNYGNLTAGLTYFALGLFKKVVLADSIAVYVSPVFTAAASGEPVSFLEAWGGALAYTLQFYFDFSGYSDMAIGLALIFAIRLPINFNSPYKAVNIIDFWRRWHMTLSQFLRDYLYIALGGNRYGPVRRYVNLFVTMVLGGLWHGAGWTFVIWGALHGIYLIINHAWHGLRRIFGGDPSRPPSLWGIGMGRAVTLLAVIVGWVFFRAESPQAAVTLLESMVGYHGVCLPLSFSEALVGTSLVFGSPFIQFKPLAHLSADQVLLTTLLVGVVLLFPNTQQIMGYIGPNQPRTDRRMGQAFRWLQWAPTRAWAMVMGLVLLYTVTQLSQISEFLYFQF